MALNERPAKPDPGKTSVRLGAAFLRPSKERDHYELMRPAITVRNEGDRTVTEQHGEAIGPLAVYRIKRRGDKINLTEHNSFGPPPEMRTSGPDGKPLTLILVWWPGQDAKNEDQ